MMKYISFLFVSLGTILIFSSCTNLYRVYNDEDLNIMAISQYGFSEVLFFKIIDSDTAKELTGNSYNNSGVIIGKVAGEDRMLFVPKLTSQEPFMIDLNFDFDIEEIYQKLKNLEDDEGEKIFVDTSNDYGGLSISVWPYEEISEIHSDLVFNTPIFFIITTDNLVIYVAHVVGGTIFFNNDYEIVS